MPAPLPPAEIARLRALLSCGLLDTPAAPEFDHLTALAAETFGVPIVLITLVDAERQWFKSRHGWDRAETPRGQAFCAHTILGHHPLVVPDARLDPRFADNPLVTGAPHIRFYAGAPLTNPEGHNLGSVCLLDFAPRVFSEADAARLARLASVAMTAVEAHRTIRQLRATEERLWMLESSVENANDAIIITEAGSIDEPGPRIIYANRAFTRMSGHSVASVIGKTPRMFQGPRTDPETRATIRRALERRQSVCVEILNYRKDGGEFWVELNIVPVADEQGRYTHWVSVQRDTTERKAVQRALEEARDEAERANHAKSEFLSRMSHELRTPLNAILGFGQLLELSEPTVQQRESIDHVLRGGRHLLDLINEVLDIARIESGRLDFQLEAEPVARALEEAVALVRLAAQKRGITVEIAAGHPALEGAAVLVDPQRFKQVLLNLLSNAVKYNRPQGRVVLACGPAPAPGRLRVSVRDTGPGIAVADLPRLFAPFERLGAANTEVEGTGIGLVISKRLVEGMGGTISLESTVGAGSTFSVDLPMAYPADGGAEPGASGEAATQLGGTEPAPRTVLCIDDNFSNLELIKAVLLPRKDLTLLAAKRADAGLELARERRPDLILLDLHLADIPGDIVLTMLKEDPRTRHVPVVMVSADATGPQVQCLLDLGAHAYLTKPFRVPVLLQTVDEALAVGR